MYAALILSSDNHLVFKVSHIVSVWLGLGGLGRVGRILLPMYTCGKFLEREQK